MPLYMVHAAVAITLFMVVVVAALVSRIKRLTAALRAAERNYAAVQTQLAACVFEADSLEEELVEAIAVLQREKKLREFQAHYI